jgi:hypothetical protein
MKRAAWDGVILGLDVATTTGWCMGHTQCGSPSWGTRKLPSAGDAAATMAMAAWLEPILVEGRPGLVAAETPPSLAWGGGKTNAKTLLRLNKLVGKVEELCFEAGIDFALVDTTEWRKPLTGMARFPKTRRPYPPIAALAQIGFDVADHNAADAFGVWLYALAVRNPDAALNFHPLAQRSRQRRGASQTTPTGNRLVVVPSAGGVKAAAERAELRSRGEDPYASKGRRRP